MKVVVAIDSFKGSISSIKAGNAVKKAAEEVFINPEVIVFPLADGGEGTMHALHSGLGGELIRLDVVGPKGDRVTAEYCILKDGTAVFEMASAAGITLLKRDELDPLHTTTYGVGEIIKDALERGCRDFIVGIGGSATNDGGSGMLSALGFEFLDDNKKPIPLGAAGLEGLRYISADKVLPQLKNAKFRIACDVTNPLCGNNGCSAVFGPQKGATPESVAKMDLWLKNYADLSATVSDRADQNYPGAGAAGGLGFAFLTFLNAKLRSGVEIILECIDIKRQISTADLVVTGEGRLDSQTAMGKAPIGVADLAKKYNKKVIAFAGAVTDDADILNQKGIDAYFCIQRGAICLEDALNEENAERNLYSTAKQVFGLLSV